MMTGTMLDGYLHKECDMQAATRRTRVKNLVDLEAFMLLSEDTVVPDDVAQRKAFETVMPSLYVLRNKGCSFAQLANLLNQCGLTLQPSTVRNYYYELLSERMQTCQSRMNEQLLLLAEVRKGQSKDRLSYIPQRAQAIMESRKVQTSVLPETSVSPGVATKPKAKPVPKETTTAQVEKPSSTIDRPQVSPQVEKAKTEITGSAPSTPNFEKVQSQAEKAKPDLAKANFTCRPLQEGVKPLQERDEVPPEAYLPGTLEHPMIPGLNLSLVERLYGAALEYTNSDGELFIETPKEKRFRVQWKKPIPETITSTSHQFTRMNPDSYAKAT